jgi:Uma2 family endonuclease
MATATLQSDASSVVPSASSASYPLDPRGRWPFGKRVPKGEAWDMVPDLAVEVVSPANGVGEIAEKIRDYFQTGTQRVWVIYPETRQVYVYSTVRDLQILFEPDDLDGGELLPGFRLSLSRLFEDEIEAEPV